VQLECRWRKLYPRIYLAALLYAIRTGLLLSFAFDLVSPATSYGSEAHDANGTRPCNLTLAQVVYRYQLAVDASIFFSSGVFGW